MAPTGKYSHKETAVGWCSIIDARRRTIEREVIAALPGGPG